MAKTGGSQISALFIQVAGGDPMRASSFTAPTVELMSGVTGPEKPASLAGLVVGEGEVTLSPAQGGALVDRVLDFFGRRTVAFDLAVLLADQNFEVRRRVDMDRCLVTAVSFPTLDGGSKSQLQMTVRFQPERVRFSPDGGKVKTVTGKAKQWLASNFRADIPGITAAHLVSVSLPKVTAKLTERAIGRDRPTAIVPVFSMSDLETEHTNAGFDEAQSLVLKTIDDGIISSTERMTITVDLLDATLKAVLATFTLKGCAPRRLAWSADASQETTGRAHVSFVVEGMSLERKGPT